MKGERKEVYPADVVLAKVPDTMPDQQVIVDFDGDPIDMASLRYLVFKRGRQCAKCGIVGEYFAKERHNTDHGQLAGKWHFEFYGKDKDGNEVMMVKDRIVPKQKDVPYAPEHFRVLCRRCSDACQMPKTP